MLARSSTVSAASIRSTIDAVDTPARPDCLDDIWLEAIGREGWVAISHDTRKNFVATAPGVNAFIDAHPAPWIAKVYRPTVSEIAKSKDAPGSVSLWYPRK